MSMFTMCPACGSDWCSGCECVKRDMQKNIDDLQKRIDLLEALLRESKREHLHCDDSYYCCNKCDSPDHYEPSPHEPCTCGADEWNKRVDEALR